MKTVVVGLGNPILRDDGVGIHVVRQAAQRVRREDVVFAEATVGGLRLLDLLVGAIVTPEGKPGEIRHLGPNDLRAPRHAGSSHDVSLPAALALGRRMGMALPPDERITILAVEVVDVLTFGEECTPQVAAALPRAVEALLRELGED
ncbi:MAG: hydrogenase maturation protease [Chloroflexia bacterium]